jgi:hypothetical protein
MSSCCQERLEKIKHSIVSSGFIMCYSASNKIYFNGLSSIFVVEIRNVPKKCITCDHIYFVELYWGWPSYYATHDGITRLPLKEVSREMETLSTITLYDLPNFGTFLVKLVNYDSKSLIMMYNPLIQINKPYESYTVEVYTQCMFEVNDEPVFCYKTKQNEFIITDTDNNILKMETIHSNIVDGVLTFKTPYGDLMGSVGIYEYPREWVFVSNSSGMHTKPAIRPVDD